MRKVERHKSETLAETRDKMHPRLHAAQQAFEADGTFEDPDRAHMHRTALRFDIEERSILVGQALRHSLRLGCGRCHGPNLLVCEGGLRTGLCARLARITP